MIVPTGVRPRRCSPARSLMSGTERCTATRGRRPGGLRIGPRAQIIWVKQRFTWPRRLPLETRTLLVRRARGKTATGRATASRPPFGRCQQQSLRQSAARAELGHGTQKPVECMRRPIVNNSRPGQTVYDPSRIGHTLIAAEMTGRGCCGVEISPAYVDVVVQRWQDFTGRAAIHQARVNRSPSAPRAARNPPELADA